MAREDAAASGPLALFCARLKRLQQAAGLTQASLAAAANRSTTQMSAILNGQIKKRPDWIVVEKIVGASLVHAKKAGRLVPPDLCDQEDWSRRYFDLEQDLDAGARLRKKGLATRQPDAPQRAGIEVYLRTLIGWLNTDPWPRWFGQPAPAPSAIERKLRLVRAGDGEQDADELARRCTRLIVLGGPGTGKTWFGRRTARLCAEAALSALAGGASLDDVELPVYTTCPRLLAEPPGDGIRHAIVASALGLLPDLGGARIVDALRGLFEDRDAPTLLVADSMDEARGVDERVRQADWLPAAWRIVLTSRPGTWSGQLATSGSIDSSRQVGVIQPLRYPDDVEPFVAAWFSGRPDWAANLISQLRDRPAVGKAATVPLILAFYCIVGGDQLLPARQVLLYDKVLHRMLTSTWRGNSNHDLDLDECLATLCDWAWSAAVSNPVSELGAWTDEFRARRPRKPDSRDNRDALDNVAVPLGMPDPDTGMTPRRFVHRSIHEHLVAEHIACLAVEEAAEKLLPHLWYDADWEYSLPAAIVMHPRRDELLRALISRAATSDRIPVDLSVIDVGSELSKLLVRIAYESGEGDWSPEITEVIGSTWIKMGHIQSEVAVNWPTISRRVREPLLRRLINHRNYETAIRMTRRLVELAPSEEEQAQACEVLLGLLEGETNSRVASMLASRLAQLNPSVSDKQRAFSGLLDLLSNCRPHEMLSASFPYEINRLATSADDRRRARDALLKLITAEIAGTELYGLMEWVVKLATSEEDKQQTLEALLRLANTTGGWNASTLVSWIPHLVFSREDKCKAREAVLQLLARQQEVRVTVRFARTLAELDPSTNDRREIRDALLQFIVPSIQGLELYELMECVAMLSTSGEDKRQARGALLQLASTSDGWTASRLVSWIAELDPSEEDKGKARETLWRSFASTTNRRVAACVADALVKVDSLEEDKRQLREPVLSLLVGTADFLTAYWLVCLLAELEPSAEDKSQAREVLLGLLPRVYDGEMVGWLSDAMVQVSPTTEDRRHARERLLSLLCGAAENKEMASRLVDLLTQLEPSAEDLRQAREPLLNLLLGNREREVVCWLVDLLRKLEPSSEDKAQAREVLLNLLPCITDRLEANWVVYRLLELQPSVEDRRLASETLLSVVLSSEARSQSGDWLLDRFVALQPSAEDKSRARDRLLSLLPGITDGQAFGWWIELLVRLEPSAEDKSRARDRLLSLLSGTAERHLAAWLIDLLEKLDPSTRDLIGWRTWTLPPTRGLLSEARRNSALEDWLAVLHLLPGAGE